MRAMLKLFYLFSMSILLPGALLTSTPVLAEGDEEYFEEVVEEEAVEAEEEIAQEPGPVGDMKALRAQVASLTNKVQHLEGQLKKGGTNPGSVMPVNGPKNAASVIDPDVQDLMNEIGATDEKQVEDALEAHNPEEAKAMVKARKTAGKLPKNETQSDFNTLHRLYDETMAAVKNPAEFNKKANAFKTMCSNYIEKNNANSSSRSALYYLGCILLEQSQIKEAQNAFARVYRGDEKGPHAADALIGMSQVLILQGNKTAAIKFLEKIKKDFKPDYLTEETKASFKSLVKQSSANLSLGGGTSVEKSTKTIKDQKGNTGSSGKTEEAQAKLLPSPKSSVKPHKSTSAAA